MKRKKHMIWEIGLKTMGQFKILKIFQGLVPQKNAMSCDQYLPGLLSL